MATGSTPDHSKPIPAEMQTRLEAALDALLRRALSVPLREFLTAERENAPDEYPDVWRHAAAHLYGCPPQEVTEGMRSAVKHACSSLLELHRPEGIEKALRELLGTLKRG